MTNTQKKALLIVHEYPFGITPSTFAEKMWPDSPGWQKVSNVGRGGAARGVAMPLAGGSYLARLAAKKWLRVDICPRTSQKHYQLTFAGVMALKEVVLLKP